MNPHQQGGMHPMMQPMNQPHDIQRYYDVKNHKRYYAFNLVMIKATAIITSLSFIINLIYNLKI
jgi:hypothetical protein